MRRLFALFAFAAATMHAQKQPFTLQQILSAPYALSLTAAPVGDRFAWVENAEGVRNIWVGSAKEPARQITHYTQDDGEDISNLAWSPDAQTIVYTYGAESGASGRPADPAHTGITALHIILQPLAPGAPAEDLGEGHAPLFMQGGCGVFFLRAGKIWARGFLPVLRPNSVTRRQQGLPDLPEGPLLCNTKEQGAFQLVPDRGRASSLTLSPDGNLLAYISHRGSHSFLAIYDLRALFLTFPAPSTGNDSAPAFSPDGKQLAWLRAPFTEAPEFATNRTSPNPWSIQLHDLAAHTTRTVYSPEPNKPGSILPHLATGEPRLFWTTTAPAEKSGSPSFAPSAKGGVSVTSNVNRANIIFASEADGWLHLYGITTAKGHAPRLLTTGNYEVEDPTLSRDYRFIYFSSNKVERDSLDVDKRHIWRVDVANGAIESVGATRVGIETHPQISEDGLAALLADNSLPMRPAVWSDGSWLFLHPFAPGVTGFPRAADPTQVLFGSSDNLQIHAQLFVPKSSASTKHPAILFFHGGPRRQMLLGYPAMDYYSNAYAMNQYLASRGYIVLSVNYRGGIGYGMNFRQCEHCGADGAAEYADALAAAAYLRSRPDVDAQHIGIWGGSYGGYFVALALARNSDIFAAGVDFHGVHEWAAEDNAKADWLDRPGTTLADQERIAALAHASSPMSDIAKWRSPVLLIHGDDDPDVAYNQTPMLADALRARNVPVEELIFPDEVHGFILHKDWIAAYQAASDFFDLTLKRTPSQK